MERTKLNNIGVKIQISFLILLQLFPPLWIQDVTSLRHFLIAIFDLATFLFIIFSFKKQNIKCANPLRYKPIIILLCLIIWMGISIFWAINTIEGLATLNRWIIVWFCAFFISILLSNNNKAFDTLVYITILTTFVNILVCIIGYYHFDVYISQRRNLMLNGGYGNKNIFAACLLLKLPLLYYATIRYKKIWKFISLILIFSVCFCLIIISTRSSFIGLFFQLIMLIMFALIEKFRFQSSNKYLVKISLIVCVAVVGFLLGNAFIKYNYNKYAAKNVQNNYTIEARVATIESGNSKGRLLIWKNTSEIIKRNPIWGYGVGNHKLAIMQVEAAKKINYVVSDHAHNDFLEMQSELGVIGELLYLLLYLSMFLIGAKIILNKHTQRIYRLIALCSLLMLITYMNDAMFNFPLERASMQLYLALSIGMMVFVKYKTNNSKNLKINYSLSLFAFILGISFIIEGTHFYSSILQHQRILCHNSGNKNNVPPEYWVKHTPCLPNIDESTKPIMINNASMFALQGDYRTAINMVKQDNSNPYYGLKEYRLASYYAHLDMMDSAFFWADSCIKVKPLCYDPVIIKASYFSRLGDKETEIRIIKNYLKKTTKEPRAWSDLINIYIKEGDYQQAMKTYEQAMVDNYKNSKILVKKWEIEELKKENETTK